MTRPLRLHILHHVERRNRHFAYAHLRVGVAHDLPTNPLATTVFVPVGAKLASAVSSGTPSATGFCLP